MEKQRLAFAYHRRWGPRSRAALLAGATMASLSLAAPASVEASHSTTIKISDSVPGASATVHATRDGWGARVQVWVWDTRSDGDCAFVKVILDVANGNDAEKRTENCSGVGSVRLASYRLSAPMLGTHLRAIKTEVCRNVPWGSDDCAYRTVTLPQMHSHATASRIAATDAVMELSMSAFQALKDQAPPPYDWSDDGCSVPGWLPYTSAFRPACERHDFGYRNFGGSKDYQPSDARRARVDARFKEDMYKICEDKYTWQEPFCKVSARAGYNLVRTLGGPAFFGED
jgi:hypothetical protein